MQALWSPVKLLLSLSCICMILNSLLHPLLPINPHLVRWGGQNSLNPELFKQSFSLNPAVSGESWSRSVLLALLLLWHLFCQGSTALRALTLFYMLMDFLKTGKLRIVRVQAIRRIFCAQNRCPEFSFLNTPNFYSTLALFGKYNSPTRGLSSRVEHSGPEFCTQHPNPNSAHTWRGSQQLPSQDHNPQPGRDTPACPGWHWPDSPDHHLQLLPW